MKQDNGTIFEWAPVQRLVTSAKASGLFVAGEAVVARAPGRLDVMGGVADYSGSVVCEMPLATAAAAMAQGRGDGVVVCRSMQEGGDVTVPRAALDVADAARVRNLVTERDSWARYVLGCVWWLGRRLGGVSGGNPGGVTVMIDSDVPLGGGVSSSAAVEVATMTAAAALWGVKLTPMEIAAACQVVENQVVGAPCGVMDQVTSCMGVHGAMVEILCQSDPATGLPAQVLGEVAVPEGYAFVGVHSGVRHEVKGDPYTDTRVAAFMAQKIISTLAVPDPSRGHLANVDLDEFKHQWSWELPTSMRGSEFLERYGGTHDAVTTVRPDKVYPVRNAARHHVGEMSRVRRFVGLMRGTVDGHRSLLTRMVRAGAMMYASHESYSVNANLGHALTDRLVELVHQRGHSRGLMGAKITGGGSGGTVAVLLRDTDEARAELQAVREEYARESGRTTMLMEGTSPGAAALGAAKVLV